MSSVAVRDTAINKAIADRKIEAGSRDFYERMWEADPSETLGLLTTLPKPGAPAPVPAAAPVAQAGDDYPTTHLTPEERDRIARAEAGAPPPRLNSEPGGRS